LLRLLRQDFPPGGQAKADKKKVHWEIELAKFGGTLSSTDEFMKRKAD
jgi:hypothetical protein